MSGHIIDMGRYQKDPNMKGGRMIADMLDWAAQQYAYVTVGYNDLFAKLYDLRQLPKLDAPEVVKWAHKIYAVSETLEERYERALITDSKMFGCRATADAGEYLRVMRKRAETFLRGGARLAKMGSRFNPEDVPRGKGYEEDLAWYHSYCLPALQEIAKPVIKMLGTPPRRALSLPPKRDRRMQ
jgi:hypothetical protein